MIALFKLRISILLFLGMLPLLSFAQKAYETEIYTATFQGKQIKLALANGYAGASVISLYTDNKHKPMLFIPDSGVPGKDYIFRPKEGNSTNYFILTDIQEAYTVLPKYICGIYRVNNVDILVKFHRVSTIH